MGDKVERRQECPAKEGTGQVLGVEKRREPRGGEGDWRRTGTNEAGEESLLERGGGQRFLLPFLRSDPSNSLRPPVGGKPAFPQGPSIPRERRLSHHPSRGLPRLRVVGVGPRNAGVVAESEME